MATLGQWTSPVAYRNLSGILHVPAIVPFWNIKKS
jgi:hypothetical protein